MAKNKAAIALGLILLCLTTSSVNLQPVKSQNLNNIIINSDGSINPTSAPILCNGTKYTLTDNFDGYLTIKASNIVLDGAGHVVKGIEGENIVNVMTTDIYNLTNLVIQNFVIQGEFDLVRFGIRLASKSNISVINNSISNTYIGINLYGSGNTVSGNTITNTQHIAIQEDGGNSVIFGNTITNTRGISGIAIAMSSHSLVLGNLLKDNQYGIFTWTYGGFLFPYAIPPTGSVVYGNNFIDNSYNALNNGTEGASIGEVAKWDNGSMGNYWSDYNGQGVYVIDQNNVDNHPLSAPIDISKLTLESLFSVIPSPTPTVTPPSSTSTPTPTVPEYPSWTILLLISVALAVAGLLFFFKRRRRESP